MSKVKINLAADACWEWLGSKTPQGYGYTMYNGRSIGAHRAMYILVHGSIPNGLIVMHICDNPSCVRPSHLKAGTHKENTQDAIAKGRMHNGSDHRIDYSKLKPMDKDEFEKVKQDYPESVERIIDWIVNRKYHPCSISRVAKNGSMRILVRRTAIYIKLHPEDI